MNLKLSFYQSGIAPLPSASTGDQGKIVFDQVNDRIGANNFWFGSSYAKASSLDAYLPLSGGIMTGSINLNDNPLLLRNSRPVVSWVTRNSGEAIELGNVNMRLRLTSGSNGLLYHYYQGNPETYEAVILDGYNTKLSNYMVDVNGTSTHKYGYTLTLPQGTNTNSSSSFNLLGIGQLDPKATIDSNGQFRITVGGETSSPIAISSSRITGSHYYSYDNTNNELYHIVGSNFSMPIEIGDGLQVTKIVHTNPDTGEPYTGGQADRPENYHLKIEIDPSLISRIEALEARSEVTYTIE